MIEFAISTFVTLFIVINPLALSPIFLVLTQGKSEAVRRGIGLRGSLIALGLLALFGLTGEGLLAQIGISMPAFRISGGMLLFVIAFNMLFGQAASKDDLGDNSSFDPTVFPLATPMIAGPGAMTSMILLAGQNPDDVLGLVVLMMVLLVVLGMVMLAFLAASTIERVLGATGIMVVTRLLGVLLAAMSVQHVIDGFQDLGLTG